MFWFGTDVQVTGIELDPLPSVSTSLNSSVIIDQAVQMEEGEDEEEEEEEFGVELGEMEEEFGAELEEER